MLATAVVLAGSGAAAATISSAAAEGGGPPTKSKRPTRTTPTKSWTTTSTDQADTSTDPTDTSADPDESSSDPADTSTEPTTTETTPTTPGLPPIVPPVLPGGFAQAVTTLTTVVVGAPITVAGTVNNTTINNIPPTVAAPDICVNMPGVQSSVPAGLVLTLAKNGGLVCVTPTIARSLHPAAVPVQLPPGSRIVYAKRAGLLCVGRDGSSAKPVIVPATTSAQKVLILAKSGKLVCLGP